MKTHSSSRHAGLNPVWDYYLTKACLTLAALIYSHSLLNFLPAYFGVVYSQAQSRGKPKTSRAQSCSTSKADSKQIAGKYPIIFGRRDDLWRWWVHNTIAHLTVEGEQNSDITNKKMSVRQNAVINQPRHLFFTLSKLYFCKGTKLHRRTKLSNTLNRYAKSVSGKGRYRSR